MSTLQAVASGGSTSPHVHLVTEVFTGVLLGAALLGAVGTGVAYRPAHLTPQIVIGDGAEIGPSSEGSVETMHNEFSALADTVYYATVGTVLSGDTYYMQNASNVLYYTTADVVDSISPTYTVYDSTLVLEESDMPLNNDDHPIIRGIIQSELSEIKAALAMHKEKFNSIGNQLTGLNKTLDEINNTLRAIPEQVGNLRKEVKQDNKDLRIELKNDIKSAKDEINSNIDKEQEKQKWNTQKWILITSGMVVPLLLGAISLWIALHK